MEHYERTPQRLTERVETQRRTRNNRNREFEGHAKETQADELTPYDTHAY
jgi:hypothetical protein